MAFVNPPTMKNSGITWKSQVTICRSGLSSSRFLPVNAPSVKPSTARFQWPNTTAPMDTTRIRST